MQDINYRQFENLYRKAELLCAGGDSEAAFRLHIEAAGLGSPMAQFALGDMYAGGVGVARDLKKAEFWYASAFSQGVTAAAINMAFEYRKAGKMNSAKTWLKRAILKGDGEASAILVKIYLEGGPGDKRAAALLKKALLLGPGSISDSTRAEAKRLLGKIDARRRSGKS